MEEGRGCCCATGPRNFTTKLKGREGLKNNYKNTSPFYYLFTWRYNIAQRSVFI
eukprot:GDKH01008870.1.p1 GENE.GDKH01008870.1~~GDKH01008870.1.p1  ORF type:complete len:54 (+),score=0.58 GDKH01008870.1:241-402(+)